MKIKVGIIGSGTLDSIDSSTIDKARQLGKLISKRNIILLSGCGTGVPYYVVKEAKAMGCMTVGISPAVNKEEHTNHYKLPVDSYDTILFTGFGYKGRNVIFIRSCDVVIAIAGGFGTLNEFTIAFDEGKPIGVLEGTGGISDYLKIITKKIKKIPKAKLVFSKNPRELLNKLL